ncbi:putative porin [Thioalkalivibrio sp. ALE21]|uniref:porin n=1 Tax=Thioalkalivibrio sp. ALE21 TaxID=1158175 RepID=UPI000D85C738|nr:porin [Thioalkalivibrio sp. ALE21]PYG02526.1 putative porin [Thioalkalivibrio sp. ALE21]
MKKKILAVAVAGAFAVPAFANADSSVTLSGTLQTQIVGYGSYTDGAGNDIDSNVNMADAGGVMARGDGAGPNRLTFDVEHDLGGGLTALARYNTDFNVANARQGLVQRDSYVGLAGDFGTITAGRQATPYNTAGRDQMNATFLQARTNAGRAGPLGGLGNGSFLNNVVAYSNDWGMVNFAGGVVIDNNDDSDSALSARLGFNVMEDLEIYGAYTHADDHSQVTSFLQGINPNWTAGDARLGKIGVDWSQGPWSVMAEHERIDIETLGGNTVQDTREYFVQGGYSMGQIDFVLSLGHTDDRSAAGNDSDYVGFATKYNFSNSVMAYAGIGYLDDDAMDSGNGDDTTSVGAGMRVSF